MRRLLILATTIIMTMPAWAVGTVNQSLAQIPGSTNWVFTENWVGDSITGSVPSVTMASTGLIQGFRIVSVEVAPGSPAPTNNYAITMTDFAGADIFGGAGANLSNTAASILPSIPTAPPLYGSLTVNVTGNSVASAQGRILVYFAPVSQVMGNTPAGASLSANNLFTGNNTFQGSNTYSGTTTWGNNNFMRWFKNDGITPVSVVGVDNSNNTVIQDNAGNGLFFKVGGVGTGNVAPSPTSVTYPLVNFVGNLGWNNMTLNPASFGLNPGANPAGWTASAFQFGQTDATQNANAFTNTFQIKMNSSATNTLNVEKGGAFFSCLDNDTTATVAPACVGFDSLAEGPTANTNSALWGGVMRFQIDSGGGDGSGFGLEIDSTNNGTGNSNHGDVSKHKTGLWMAAFGSQPSSWMIDTPGTGTAWNNGISLRNITSGGIGLDLPNNIGLYWRNAANNADLKNIVVDGSNNMILDTASSGTGMFFRVNGSNVAVAQSTGWTSMTIGSPTINGTPTTTTITPASAGASDLGTTALPFGNLWIGTAATNNFKVQPGTTTGARVITITDPVSPTTVGLPLTIATGTATLTTAAIGAGNCGTTVTVAATGVATTDAIIWSFNAAPAGSNAGLVSWPTAGNVNFAYCPNSAETPAAATANWRVIR